MIIYLCYQRKEIDDRSITGTNKPEHLSLFCTFRGEGADRSARLLFFAFW